jgi:hypothetical protein
MQGFKPGFKPADKQKGGKIKGPGTGTSDSIKAEVPRGSYIMPADSTQQIGPKALGNLGEPVPVNVSNGEYQMPPEQVHAVGVQALNQMRDATHAPVAAGFKPQEGELYFFDGGSPAEEERRRRMQGGPLGVSYGDMTGQRMPAATPQPAPRTGAPQPQPIAYGDLQRAPSIPQPGTPAATGRIDPTATTRPSAQPPQPSTQGASPAPAQPQAPQFGFSGMQREPNVPRTGAPRQMPPGAPVRPGDVAQGVREFGQTADNQIADAPRAVAGAGQDFAAGGRAATGQMAGAGAGVSDALTYLNRGDPVKDAASAVGGFFARSSDQARLADYGNAGAPSPIAATPAAAPIPPAAVGATELPSTKGRTDYGFTPDPGQGPAPGMSVRPTSAEGINRIDNAPGLKSPLFTNLPAGQAMSGVQAGASTGGQPQAAGFAAQGGGAAARDQQASAMIAENNRIRQNRMDGRADNWTPNSAESRRDADQLSALQNRNMANERAQRAQFFGRTGERNMEMQNAAMYEADRTGGRKLESDERAAAMREEGESRRSAERNATDRERVGVDRRRADSEAEVRGFEARGLQRVERLYAAYENAKTPEERSAVAEQLRALSGKEAPNRFTVVPGGQEISPQGMPYTRPSMVFNNQSGQFVDQPAGQAAPAAPRSGEVRGGYRFKGGNPADQASWEKV